MDNGTDPIGQLLPIDSRIQYFPVPGAKLTHGELMNLAFAKATGDICIVWDDDDWYAPDRISRQIAPFADPNTDVTGTSTLYYYVHGTQKAYRYENQTARRWVGAFAIRRSLWNTTKFQHMERGADVVLLNTIPAERWCDLKDLSLLVASIHPANITNGKTLPSPSFIETPWNEIQRVTGDTLR